MLKIRENLKLGKNRFFEFLWFEQPRCDIRFSGVFIIELSLNSEIFDLRTPFLRLLREFEIFRFWPNLPTLSIYYPIWGTTWYPRKIFFEILKEKCQNHPEIKWFALKPPRTDFMAENIKKSPKIGVCHVWERKG